MVVQVSGGTVHRQLEGSADEEHEEDGEPAGAPLLAEEREREDAQEHAGDSRVDAGHEVVDGGVRLRPSAFVDRQAHRPRAVFAARRQGAPDDKRGGGVHEADATPKQQQRDGRSEDHSEGPDLNPHRVRLLVHCS